jgi:hypothetical protein
MKASGVSVQVSGIGRGETSYESTHSWNSEPQPATSSAVSNIEQEISNDEVWNRCAQSFSKIIMIEYLTSIFVIPCSIFVIRFFGVSFSIKLATVQASGGAEA